MPTDSNLHKAAHKGDIDELKKYIEGIELPEDEEKIDVNEAGAADRRPLHRSAGAGHMECCVYLLEKGATIDCIDYHHSSCLYSINLKKNIVSVFFLKDKISVY